MSSVSPGILACVSLACLFACGASRVTPDTRGTTVAAGPCGRGVVVVESDYQSTNVVPPGNAVTGPQLVLIDRTPVGVLRFVDLASAQISSELAVGTGFSANPHDYLPLGEHKAYVSRYDSNPNPGSQPWDGGGDILLVDPLLPAITGRIDLAPAMAGEPAQFTPNPGRLVQVGGRVFVLLASYANDYMSATTSRVVELDPSTDSIVSTTLLDGFKGCDAFALSPEQNELAVACTGGDLQDTPPSIDAAGLALLDISAAPKLSQQFKAALFGTNAVGFSIDYLAPGLLFFGTLGYLEESQAVGALDSLLRLDATSGTFQRILQSQSQPFTLGDVRCAPACGACFVADAERAGGSVLRFAIDASNLLGAPKAIRAETQIGLPPRYLGVF
jgi:hypothetical protein